MKKSIAKVLSIVLVLVMVVSAMPVSAMSGISDGSGRDISDWWRDLWKWWVKPTPIEVIDYPAQQLEAELAGGVTVTVEAPKGALPAKTRMSAVSIDKLSAVQAAVDSAEDVSGTVLTAVDITFYNGNSEVQPRKDVQVTITSDALSGMDNLSVVHLDVSAENLGPNSDAEPVDDVETGDESVVFNARHFSVYAVIDEGDDGDDARLTVRFFHHDDDAEPEYTVNVTVRDKDILGSIIEDPELPEIGSDELFCGWSVGKNYTSADVDGQHTIDFIRDEVKTYLEEHAIHEGDTFDVYAMVFKYFNVSYVDENGETTLGTDVYYSKSSSMQVTVQLQYAPYEQGFRFIGWQKDDGDDTIYQNGDTVTVTASSTILRAQVQQGYWISFIESPATSDNRYKGATYNAPVFCVNGVIPANARPNPDPTLAGYNFGGWYTNFNAGADAAHDSWSGSFSFTGTIDQDTEVYAKWTLKESVPYTVVLWKQSVNDNKNAADSAKTYDYVFSTTLYAAPGTNVSALDLSYFKTTHSYTSDGETYDNRINTKPDGSGTWYSFYGFHYNSTRSAMYDNYHTIGGGVVANNTKVLANGTTVIDLCWDRELVTYDFVTVTESYDRVRYRNLVNGTRYYFQDDGTWYYVTYNSTSSAFSYTGSSSSTGYATYTGYFTATLPSSDDGNSYYVEEDDGYLYPLSYYGYYSSAGTYVWTYTYESSTWYVRAGASVYKKSTFNLYSKTETVSSPVLTYTGLYGQKLNGDTNSYSWPDYVGGTRYRWFNAQGGSTFTSFEDTFGSSNNDNPDSEFHSIYYGYEFNGDTYVYHYLQNTDGSWPATPEYTIPTRVGNGMVFRAPQGFSRYRFRIALPSGVTTYQTAAEVTSSGSGDDITYTLVDPETHTSSGGWTAWLDYGTVVDYEGNDRYETDRWNVTEGGIQFRYTRDKYRVQYMVGTYVDGNGNTVDGPMSGRLKQSEQIYYQASISGLGSYDPIAAGDFTDEAYVFEGWFSDSTCTTPYSFSGKTMPLNGVTVYAKFRERQYRVFLEPNVPAGVNVSWNGGSGQAMNFRIDYLGQISNGQPIEGVDPDSNYVLVGWYLDEDFEQVFNFSTRLTDDIAVAYPKTEPTETNGTNGDVDRPWINKKVVLYAKWRKVLDGANGITVSYDAIESNEAGHTGTFSQEPGTPTIWKDPLSYLDQATAIARSASTPDIPKDWQFLQWEILDKNGNGTGKYVYPGQDFDVDFNYAVEGTVRSNPDQAENGTRSGSIDTKAGETWVEYTASTIDTSKTYLIGFAVGSTVYLATNGTGYATHSGDKHGYTAVAQFNGGKIVGVSGYTSDLADCQWNFSAFDSSSYYIKSAKNSSYYLYAYSSYSDLFVSSNAPYNGWYWSGNALKFANSRYASYYYTSSRNFMQTVTSAGTNTTVKLYVQDDSGSGSSETVDFKKVTTPVVGVPYVIVSDAADAYALSKDRHPNTDLSENKCWLLSVAVTKTGDIIAVPEDEVSNVTWVAGGNASAGYTWRNVANNNYLGLTSAGYLIDSTTAVAWLYDSNRYFNNQIESDGYYYLSLDTEDTTYYDYTVAKASGADPISIYARSYNLTINYEMSDGTTAPAAQTIQVAQGENYSVSVPAVTGYTASQTVVSGTMNTSDVEVTVTYSPAAANYTVTFQDWDGTVLKTQTVSEGGSATPPADPTRAGYTFTGWSGNYTNVHANETVIAQYTQNAETGHWEWQPTDTIEPNEDYLIGFVVGDTVYLAVNYNETATNHYYYNNSNTYLGYTGIGIRDGEIVTGVTGNATDLQYCTWVFSETTGGTITSGSNPNYYLRTYSNTNYNDLYPDTSSTYATNWVWDSTNKTLTRSINGTTMYAEYASASGTGNYMGVFSSHASGEYVQLYSKVWVEPTVKHTVTFVDGYTNAVIDAQEVADGQAATAPTPPDHEAEHYFFQYWSPSDFSNVTEDMTVTAVYTFIQEGHYTVVFKDWNGRVISTQIVAEGESAAAPADPVRPGYNFTGWDKDFSNVTRNLVVTAKYSRTISKTYTVTLRAVYGPRVQQEKTHITWHANNGSGDYKYSADVIMNENIAIEYPEAEPGAKEGETLIWGSDDNLVWEDHEFLGWARLPISDMQGNISDENIPTDEDYIKERVLTEDDLFLKYIAPEGDETHGTFQAKFGDEWKNVEYVAADEIMPYHGMYAVWATVFYVYHSSDNTVEKIQTTKGNGNEATKYFDITKYVADGYLYGGYYKKYEGASDAVKAADYSAKSLTYTAQTRDGLDTVALANDGTGCVPYITADGTVNVTWNWNDSYNIDTDGSKTEPDANGMSMQPEPGTTYYLKEVPDTMYLQPYLHYTYNIGTGELKSWFLISDIDDCNYQETGFVITDGRSSAHVAASITVQTTNGGTSVTLTPNYVFGDKNVKSGYLSYIQYSSASELVGKQIAQYWRTPDGLYVTGTLVRTYTKLSNVNSLEKTETDAVSTISAN